MHQVILFIEDDRIARRNIAAFMRCSGHEVHEAEVGEAAFKLLSTTDFDVVISDLNLPGSIKGIEILAATRRFRRPIKTILITGFRSEGMKSGRR